MYVFNSKGDVLKNFIFLYNHKISYWILATFLSEAVEASRCYFFENQECISKVYNLRIPKLLSNMIFCKYFNLSEPIHNVQFNVRYPVAVEISMKIAFPQTVNKNTLAEKVEVLGLKYVIIIT